MNLIELREKYRERERVGRDIEGGEREGNREWVGGEVLFTETRQLRGEGGLRGRDQGCWVTDSGPPAGVYK